MVAARNPGGGTTAAELYAHDARPIVSRSLRSGRWGAYNLGAKPRSWSSCAYLPRVDDAELDARLAAAGAVVIEGPKATARRRPPVKRVASSVLLDVDENARRAAAVDPGLVLDGRSRV